MVSVLIYNIASRSEIELSIQPVRQPLFVGVVERGYPQPLPDPHYQQVAGRAGLPHRSARDPGGCAGLGRMREVSVRQGKSLMCWRMSSFLRHGEPGE